CHAATGLPCKNAPPPSDPPVHGKVPAIRSPPWPPPALSWRENSCTAIPRTHHSVPLPSAYGWLTIPSPEASGGWPPGSRPGKSPHSASDSPLSLITGPAALLQPCPTGGAEQAVPIYRAAAL